MLGNSKKPPASDSVDKFSFVNLCLSFARSSGLAKLESCAMNRKVEVFFTASSMPWFWMWMRLMVSASAVLESPKKSLLYWCFVKTAHFRNSTAPICPLANWYLNHNSSLYSVRVQLRGRTGKIPVMIILSSNTGTIKQVLFTSRIVLAR